MIPHQKLDQLYSKMEKRHDVFSEDVKDSIDLYKSGANAIRLPSLILLEKYPVPFEEFTLGKNYLNSNKDEVWPAVMDCLIELNNPEGDRLGQKYYEAVYTGGIGTAKTTRALFTTAYQLYLLSCYRSPHLLLGQNSSSEIFIIFQSLNGTVARDVDYTRFRRMVEVSPYFTTTFPYRKDLESRLVFPKNISVFPVSGETSATIGQNVYGGFMDEVNFMEVIQKSQKKVDGGVFNQAIELYNSIASRRESRFMRKGLVPGIFCLSSSKNYPGQFTDRKRDESKTDPGIYYRDQVVWDMKPRETFTGGWFHVFIGSETKKPFIIEPDEVEEYELKHPTLVKPVPVEYRKRFVNDIYIALREVAGESTVAKSPYFPNVEALDWIFDTNIKSIFSTPECDFDKTQVSIVKSAIIKPQEPRFCHVDLGLTSDAAGICVGFVKNFVDVDYEDTTVTMPNMHIDGTLRVNPPVNGEINFEKIRKIFYKLTSMGINIVWITFDSYQSVDSIQILRGQGYFTGHQSMDEKMLPYDMLKTALLEGRIESPEDTYLRNELIHLERTEKGKIDHTPYSTKDLSDAFAGVVYGLTSQRLVWARHNVSPNPIIRNLMSSPENEYEYE